MHKTKHALIRACHGLDRLELQSKRFPLSPNKCDFPLLSLNRCPAADASRLELKVDHIEKRLSVQFMNLIARLQSDTLGDRSCIYRQHAQLLRLAGPVRLSIAILVPGLDDLLFEILIVS